MSKTIGIDIGYETVKVVGLERHGKRYLLGGMNVVSIPHNSWQIDNLLNHEAIAKAIKQALATAKPHPIMGKKAMLALPESVIFSGTFSMPQLTNRELEQAIPFEVAEKLSINLEEYYFDYEKATSLCHPLDQAELNDLKAKQAEEEKKNKKEPNKPKAAEPQLTIFAVAAKKTLIQSAVDLCSAAGLELTAIEIKPAAIARAVVPGNDQKARAIIDLGAGSTGASIVEGKNIRVTSTVPWGVEALLTQEALTPAQLQKELTTVFDELVHITKFFENRVCPGIKVEEVIISGSGANLGPTAEVFQSETGLKSRLALPFNMVDTDHFPVPDQMTHTFTDAVGLAMRRD